jgi:hypothetical protein
VTKISIDNIKALLYILTMKRTNLIDVFSDNSAPVSDYLQAETDILESRDNSQAEALDAEMQEALLRHPQPTDMVLTYKGSA